MAIRVSPKNELRSMLMDAQLSSMTLKNFPSMPMARKEKKIVESG